MDPSKDPNRSKRSRAESKSPQGAQRKKSARSRPSSQTSSAGLSSLLDVAASVSRDMEDALVDSATARPPPAHQRGRVVTGPRPPAGSLLDFGPEMAAALPTYNSLGTGSEPANTPANSPANVHGSQIHTLSLAGLERHISLLGPGRNTAMSPWSAAAPGGGMLGGYDARDRLMFSADGARAGPYAPANGDGMGGSQVPSGTPGAGGNEMANTFAPPCAYQQDVPFAYIAPSQLSATPGGNGNAGGFAGPPVGFQYGTGFGINSQPGVVGRAGSFAGAPGQYPYESPYGNNAQLTSATPGGNGFGGGYAGAPGGYHYGTAFGMNAQSSSGTPGGFGGHGNFSGPPGYHVGTGYGMGAHFGPAIPGSGVFSNASAGRDPYMGYQASAMPGGNGRVNNSGGAPLGGARQTYDSYGMGQSGGGMGQSGGDGGRYGNFDDIPLGDARQPYVNHVTGQRDDEEEEGTTQRTSDYGAFGGYGPAQDSYLSARFGRGGGAGGQRNSTHSTLNASNNGTKNNANDNFTDTDTFGGSFILGGGNSTARNDNSNETFGGSFIRRGSGSGGHDGTFSRGGNNSTNSTARDDNSTTSQARHGLTTPPNRPRYVPNLWDAPSRASRASIFGATSTRRTRRHEPITSPTPGHNALTNGGGGGGFGGLNFDARPVTGPGAAPPPVFGLASRGRGRGRGGRGGRVGGTLGASRGSHAAAPFVPASASGAASGSRRRESTQAPDDDEEMGGM